MENIGHLIVKSISRGTQNYSDLITTINLPNIIINEGDCIRVFVRKNSVNGGTGGVDL